MTDECFVDTTILVEALLKPLARRRKARSAIREFTASKLPVYAIKEFKGGALENYVWVHNKLAETRSLIKTYFSIANNIRRPNRVTTSLEALGTGSSAVIGSTLAASQTSAETDKQQAEIIMLELRRLIRKAWGDRRSITTEVVQELECFSEDAPYYDDETGMIFIPNASCPLRQDCAYAPALRFRKEDLASLLKVIEGFSRPEDNKRRSALHTLKNTPNRAFENQECRGLGDAYFALHCPQGATILTSNVKDHRPLAEALGRSVTEYRWGK
jgi:hypothetical protein